MPIAFPPAFRKLLSQFHLEFLNLGPVEDTMANTLASLGKSDCAALRAFLDDLLSKPYDAQEVLDYWWASPADMAPQDVNQVPVLLKMIGQALDSPRVLSSPIP